MERGAWSVEQWLLRILRVVALDFFWFSSRREVDALVIRLQSYLHRKRQGIGSFTLDSLNIAECGIGTYLQHIRSKKETLQMRHHITTHSTWLRGTYDEASNNDQILSDGTVNSII